MTALVEGRTCWRIAPARRVAFLVDVQSYFVALEWALAAARHQVLLLGWSFDPRTRLRPDGFMRPDAPDQIGRLLLAASKARPVLDIRVLIWRSAFAISATQGFFPHRAKDWFADSGVSFALDDTIPFGACHHQKLIVVDDALAFCSSGDLCADRWDTPAHLDSDARRLSPNGRQHAPRHEVTMMVEGPVASALGELARERWRMSQGEDVSPPAPPAREGEALWPADIPADVTDTRLGIARTEPAWRNRAAIEEIARLTVEAIALARDRLYIENQYFTSPLVAEALAARLTEPDGPEIVLISTHQSASWFDRLTMDRTRSVFVWRLRAADVFGRLAVLAPFTTGGRPIVVHAKTMVVDDALLRIGSANLNNRSQGFDTECELALEARSDAERAAVGWLADTLLGHWLGRDGAAMAAARERRGGLIGAIAELNDHGRLRPIEPQRLGPLGDFIARFHIGDPVSAADSWRPRKRSERLYAEAREVEAALSSSKSTISGR
ncbi:MAG TPA: phospholipase D-like domain-containing protein [Caulobacteraceae bacterium]|nr:phospholipase D-like domain-containing protein [Caulobacteraceae bacterium]